MGQIFTELNYLLLSVAKFCRYVRNNTHMAKIHSTAIVSKNAKIAESVEIGAYAIIEGDVEIGARTLVEPHARICSGAIVGEDCAIGSFATIAGLPQDMSFDKTRKTYAVIGKGTVIRESATVHRSTKEDVPTLIGEKCFLMASAHIAHDVVLGDRVIVAPFVALGGHVVVGDDVFISGGVMIHQRQRIGSGSLISGNSTVSTDVPPFVNVYERNCLAGLNLIGMGRRKLSREVISNVKTLFHAVFDNAGNPRKKAQAALDSNLATCPEGTMFLKFFIEAPEGRAFVRFNPSSS